MLFCTAGLELETLLEDENATAKLLLLLLVHSSTAARADAERKHFMVTPNSQENNLSTMASKIASCGILGM